MNDDDALIEETLVTIDGPDFNAGLVLRDGRVWEAADVLSYMWMWDFSRVRHYAGNKRWTVAVHQPSWVKR